MGHPHERLPADGTNDRAIQMFPGHAALVRGVASAEDGTRRGHDPIAVVLSSRKDGRRNVITGTVPFGQ